jgi:hypothetical protein
MTELTKEWLLRTIAELEEERDAVPGVVNVDAAMALAAMKLALSSLEAKDKIPELRQVIYHFRDWNEGFPVERFKADYVISWMLANYPPAQPAPVSVPEWTNEQCLEFLSIAFRHAEIKGDLELDDIRLGVKMVNGSRAAMLQGADGNSPVIPDGWVACSARMPEEGAKVLVIDAEGNKFICWHKFGFWADYRIGGNLHKINHWMTLPAAPKQEVK